MIKPELIQDKPLITKIVLMDNTAGVWLNTFLENTQ